MNRLEGPTDRSHFDDSFCDALSNIFYTREAKANWLLTVLAALQRKAYGAVVNIGWLYGDA